MGHPRSRFVRLVLTVAVLAAVAIGGGWWWRSRAPRNIVTVRWPATSPVVEGQDIPLAAPQPDASESEPLLLELGPGVHARVGTAHDLAYIEVILGDAGFDERLPLVVLLHGRGDRPRIPGGPFLGTPTPMRLIIPRGPLEVGAGFAWVRPSVTQGTHDVLAAALRERTHHLAALIRTLSTTLPTVGKPVVTGFSQGALLSFSLALHRPDAVAHAFPLAGWVPPALMPTEPVSPDLRVPIRAVHGTDDAVIPIAPTRETVATLRALEWEAQLIEFEGVGHVISPEMNAVFEAWLEDALDEEAPELLGRGVGVAGPEDAPYEPFEPLEQETIEAIDLLEREAGAGDAPAQDEPERPSDDDAGETPEREGALLAPLRLRSVTLAQALLATVLIACCRRKPPPAPPA